jgi:hypothetical protein
MQVISLCPLDMSLPVHRYTLPANQYSHVHERATARLHDNQTHSFVADSPMICQSSGTERSRRLPAFSGFPTGRVATVVVGASLTHMHARSGDALSSRWSACMCLGSRVAQPSCQSCTAGRGDAVQSSSKSNRRDHSVSPTRRNSAPAANWPACSQACMVAWSYGPLTSPSGALSQ